MAARKRLGELLVEAGLIDSYQLQSALGLVPVLPRRFPLGLEGGVQSGLQASFGRPAARFALYHDIPFLGIDSQDNSF